MRTNFIKSLLKSLLIISALCWAGGEWAPVQAAERDELVLVNENESSAYAGVPAITLSLSNMELVNVVQFIASLSKTKIEVDSSFSRSKVTCDFKDAPFAEVMAELARQVRGEVFWKDGKSKTFLFKPQPVKKAPSK